jgi:hypothetical protein
MLTKIRSISLFAASLALVALLAPGEAAAAPSAKGAKGKPWRLHFETELFGVTHFDADGGMMGVDDEWTAVGFGVGRPSLIDGGGVIGGGLPFVFYYTRPVFSFGVGYGFSRERAFVGAKVALTVDAVDVQEDDRLVAVGGRLIPYFQWMFLPDSWVRPYVEVRVGFGGTAVTVDTPVMGFDDRKTTGHVIYPQVGFGGGVHLFPTDYFSVDLGLNFDYLAPHGRTTYRDPTPADEDSEFDKTGDLINFGILTGASVFF